jgi:hypothetical protein
MYTEDYKNYINSLIDEIKITFDDVDDKTDILKLLKDTLIEIDGKIRVLSINQDAVGHLEKMEDYYNRFIKPETEEFITNPKSISKRNLESLRAYYMSYRYNLAQLVTHRLDLDGMARVFIDQRIESFTKLVDVRRILELLKRIPDTTLSITNDEESEFSSIDLLVNHYNDIPDDSINESFETIIRNCILIIKETSSAQTETDLYNASKNIVQQVKDFRSKMYNEKNFSTKSVLDHYNFL